MKDPKDLKPGDHCYLVDRDFTVKILEVKKVEGKESHWISFKIPKAGKPIGGVFVPRDNKEYVSVFLGNKLFFDKDRVLTYLNQKIKKIQTDISKIEKT